MLSSDFLLKYVLYNLTWASTCKAFYQLGVACTSGPMAATVACDSIGFLNRIDGLTLPALQSFPKFQYHLNSVPIYSDFGTHIPKTFGLTNEVLYSTFQTLSQLLLRRHIDTFLFLVPPSTTISSHFKKKGCSLYWITVKGYDIGIVARCHSLLKTWWMGGHIFMFYISALSQWLKRLFMETAYNVF